MHAHAELIERFYKAFQQRDAEQMVACYHPDIAFSDPVFPNLQGDRARAMWRMLATRAQDFSLTFRDVQADDARGTAHWEATYTFSDTGRRVLNRIDASFEFKDGKIFRHRDAFDLWRWAGMALGPVGRLLGWFPPLQNAIRKKAAHALDRFVAPRG